MEWCGLDRIDTGEWCGLDRIDTGGELMLTR
jgi:hypothetical protein